MRHKLLAEDKRDIRMSGRAGGLHVALVCCVFHTVGLHAEQTLVCDTQALVGLPSIVRSFPTWRSDRLTGFCLSADQLMLKSLQCRLSRHQIVSVPIGDPVGVLSCAYSG